mgnify:CR=1 FL=1|tara:strand:- start:137 stop:1351 length:1215 start_codon:yes stop_codon:yes gene_type:complete
MAILNKQHNFIWYGVCGSDETSPKSGKGTNANGNCSDYTLDNTENIQEVHLISGDTNQTWKKDSDGNDFTSLICGNAYYIKLEVGLDNDIQELIIPHAIHSAQNYKIAECEVSVDDSPLVINNLWIAFAKVDPVAWYFSDFLEVRGAEAENVTSYDVNGDVAEFNKYNDDIIQNNTKFDKTKHIDSDGYNPFSSTKNGFIEEYFSTYEEMIDAFHDTVVFRVEGEDREAKFVIDFVAEFDYTKFKIIDENFTEEGFTFDKTISHAFLVKSSTKPSASDGSTPNDIFETSFNADGEISLKCGDTWNYDANPKTNLIFLGNKEHKFTDVWSTESLATQSGLTNKDDDNKTPWLGGKMSLSANASNTIDSVLGTNNVFSIKEFYFQKVGQDSPIKFGDGNPKGSHCE